MTNTSRLPYCLRTILEALLRTCDDYEVTEQDVRNLATWEAAKPAAVEVPFKPSRVVLQDFTGVPAVVVLASMRDGMKCLDASKADVVNPQCQTDLVIDHTVMVDHFGT